MKNILRPKRFSVITVLLAFTIFFGFKCKCNQTKDPYADVKVNEAFAKDPPIATDVNISVLADSSEFGNLLYEAALPKEKIGADVLALMLADSSKIVLHDDGKNGDRVAGDGIYSTVMNISADSLGDFLRQQLATGREKLLSDTGKLFQFKGRLQLPANRETFMTAFSDQNIRKQPAELLKERFNLIPIRLIKLILPIPATFKQNALMVTDPSVVNDPTRTFNPCTGVGTPGGAWTFGKLMTEMANQPLTGVKPSDFVLNWLSTWKTDHTVNSDVITARSVTTTPPTNPGIERIISAWQALSGAGQPLDINKAPFKLLAIVNRFDLRSGGAYGGGNAGEGRFVFAATDANCQPIGPPNFLIILEYGVNKTFCSSIHAYAQQWVDLASMTIGTPAYNNALQAITDQFTLAGTNPSKPNQSSLDQLRSNELALGAFPWELREFHIDATTHQLINVTVKREPQIPFNGAGGANTPGIAAFGDFVNSNAATIIADNMDLPDNLSVSGVATPFIAGKAHTNDPTLFHWDAVVAAGPGHITSDEARMHISLNTCSGCHGGETDNGNFFNVGTRSGFVVLSPFLTGLVQTGAVPAFSSSPFLVSDRANRPSAASPTQWPFNDLERRGRDLLDFVSGTCFRFPPFRPIPQKIQIGDPIELTRILTFKPNTMSD